MFVSCRQTSGTRSGANYRDQTCADRTLQIPPVANHKLEFSIGDNRQRNCY